MRPRPRQTVRERHGSARLRRELTRYKQVSRGFSWGSRACRSRCALPLRLEPAALVREGRAIGAEALGVVERSGSFGETAESDKGPRPTEVCVGESRVRAEQGIVLSQNRPRIVTEQRQRREADTVVGAAWIGREACSVGVLCAREISEPSTHETERVPGPCVFRIAPDRLGEPRLRELHLTPSRRAQPTGSWAGRIVRCQLRGSIVESQRLFVPVGELERMTELERRRGALRAELPFELRRVAFGAAEVADRARQSHRQPALELGPRLLREVLFEQLERLSTAPGVREQHRFARALPWLRGTRPEAERQCERPAGCAAQARAF